MKLSENTIDILKNYSSINQGLLFRQGNVLKTISPLKTIFVEATINETFPQTFALYDLNKLLAKISLYGDDAELDFTSDRLIIKTPSKKRSDHIKYCSQQVIVAAPEKSINPTPTKCSFTISEEDLVFMRKSAGISGSPNFVFESDGTKVEFDATDVKDDASDQSKTEIGVGNGTKFKVVMKAENFKMIDGSYDVSVSNLAAFSHKTLPIKYYIAIEAAASTFGED